MKKQYIACLGLPKGMPINEYETLAEIQKDGGTDERIVSTLNNYMHQKDGLVEGRDLLATQIEEQTKFPPKTKQVSRTVDGKTVTGTVWDESEGKYIARFVAGLVDGSFTHASFPVNKAATPDQREEAVWSVLQTWVDKYDLKNDIKAPVRVSKPKTPPQYALDGATQIIANGSQKKWAAIFAKENVTFEPFDTADAAANLTNLAWAIQAREQAKARKEYA